MTLNDLPDVTFIEANAENILNNMIRDYENAYFESTGERKKLYPGDPIRIFLYTQALREFQLRVLMNDAAKQNLLKYARNEHLDNLGAFSKTKRFQATKAKAKVKFFLSDAKSTDETIPSGTRVSPGNDLYFVVIEDTVIQAGEMEAEVNTECSTEGVIGNGFTPGQINILVDPLPWIDSVENTNTSSGGADKEDDDSLRERIHLAPEGLSVAGPSGAYEHFTREYSTQVEDVKISSPSAGVVDIRVLLTDGELPDQTFLDGLKDHLNDKEKRPLTDDVQVTAPTTITYDLDVTYYIRSDNSDKESELKTEIEAAIDEYIIWQRNKIGRDVNPSEIYSRAIQAGAKRIEVTLPSFTTVGENDVAIVDTKTVTYGGLEDE
ncbi:baseplate J/gp47 family protein [Gracilibacillus sp. YIM 98692]|uniref:baseplate assembly protein n=1 Tax=Gracilibacillus sp. YIM 98692 TaxID=2663532 RepID=UPI0013D3170F|nr:baseplate J/gp47 family protein [Gracilibacillus sp. YIM 98692]